MACLEGERLYERLGGTAPPSILSRSWLVECLAEVGAFAEGITVGEEGVRIARVVDQPYGLTCAYRGVGALYLRKGDIDKAIPVLERGLALCRAADILVVFSDTASALGYAYALSGRVAEALPLLEQAVEKAVAVRFPYWHVRYWLSEAYRLAGCMEAAFAQARQALDAACAAKEQGHQAYALRLLGGLQAHHDPPDAEPAESHYRQALALAEALGMRPLQADCHLGLGILYARTGQRVQAQAALSGAIDLYRAMDMTFWLSQAEAALAQAEGNHAV